MKVLWLVLLISIFAICQATPIPSKNKLKFDQRQEGKWNVRADLENFVILVIPTSSSSAGGSGLTNSSLLDFISKTIPLAYGKKPKKHIKYHHGDENSAAADTEHFIESKTAPYHVDISRTKSHLAKLHPQSIKEEAIIARSPSVTLAKLQEEKSQIAHRLRNSRAILIKVPAENENLFKRGQKDGVLGKVGDFIEKGAPIIVTETNLDRKVTDKDSYTAKLDAIAEEMKDNKTVTDAVILAKTIQAGLIEYFRRAAELLKKQNQEYLNDAENEEESNFDQKNLAKASFAKEKKDDQFVNISKKVKVKETTKIEKEVNNKVKKESDQEVDESKKKEELFLLGALNEQCGPGLERDSYGICITIPAINYPSDYV